MIHTMNEHTDIHIHIRGETMRVRKKKEKQTERIQSEGDHRYIKDCRLLEKLFPLLEMAYILFYQL